MTDSAMNVAPVTVTQALTLELLDQTGAAIPLSAELRYDGRDPFAVTAVFGTSRGRVRWSFGRDLLLDGLLEPCGDGDVRVWPCLDDTRRAVVMIELFSTEGCALLQAAVGDVSTFMDRVSAAVEPGTESDHLDVDAAIAAILAAA